jgi:alkylhydroperoxidase/carboxymuconolactone decarboxylase family protein YurZ
MTERNSLISAAFQAFGAEAPAHAGAWMQFVKGLGTASALDKKTQALTYLAVLAALRLDSGVPFHVREAVGAGASRAEIISALLVGLPAAGHGVVQSLPGALGVLEETT